MKKAIIQLSFLVGLSLFYSTSVKAQYGTLKFCPNTPAWQANKAMVEDARGMFELYAKGPDGCWWLKSAKFAYYTNGYYAFDFEGTRKYYYNSNKKFWENGSRTACVNNPFGN